MAGSVWNNQPTSPVFRALLDSPCIMSRPVEVGEEWKGCGQTEGLEIWRIENKVPTPVAKV